MDGRQNHLRDVAGASVVLDTAILIESSSLFGWAKGDCTTNFSMGGFIVKHGSPDLPTTLAEGSLAIPSRRER